MNYKFVEVDADDVTMRKNELARKSAKAEADPRQVKLGEVSGPANSAKKQAVGE